MTLVLRTARDPAALASAVRAEIRKMDPNVPIDDVARTAGTVGYELLTGLGRRYARRYVGGK